jgi:hypothetical protein
VGGEIALVMKRKKSFKRFVVESAIGQTGRGADESDSLQMFGAQDPQTGGASSPNAGVDRPRTWRRGRRR